MKRKSIVFIIFSSLFLISGCSENFNIFAIHNNEYNNEEILRKDSCSYSYIIKEGGVDEDSANLEFSFSGNDLLWKISTEDDVNVQCNYDIDITKGSFKIILVTPDKELEKLWENQSEIKSTGSFEIPLSAGESLIKIVGNSAEGKIELEIDAKENEIMVTPCL